MSFVVVMPNPSPAPKAYVEVPVDEALLAATQVVEGSAQERQNAHQQALLDEHARRKRHNAQPLPRFVARVLGGCGLSATWLGKWASQGTSDDEVVAAVQRLREESLRPGEAGWDRRFALALDNFAVRRAQAVLRLASEALALGSPSVRLDQHDWNVVRKARSTLQA